MEETTDAAPDAAAAPDAPALSDLDTLALRLRRAYYGPTPPLPSWLLWDALTDAARDTWRRVARAAMGGRSLLGGACPGCLRAAYLGGPDFYWEAHRQQSSGTPVTRRAWLAAAREADEALR